MITSVVKWMMILLTRQKDTLENGNLPKESKDYGHIHPSAHARIICSKRQKAPPTFLIPYIFNHISSLSVTASLIIPPHLSTTQLKSQLSRRQNPLLQLTVFLQGKWWPCGRERLDIPRPLWAPRGNRFSSLSHLHPNKSQLSDAMRSCKVSLLVRFLAAF